MHEAFQLLRNTRTNWSLAMTNLSEFAVQKIRGTRVPTAEQMEEYTNVLLNIAGADGEISPSEWEFLVFHGRAVGADDATIEKWRAIDYKSQDLEDLTKSAFIKTRAKSLLYDAIRTARADNYAAEEKAAVAKAAKLLGVEPNVVAALEAFVEMEESVTKMRGSMLYSD